MENINIVLSIITVGLVFGVFQELGGAITTAIINKFKRPTVIQLTKKDGTIEEINLTADEAKGFKKVWQKMEGKNFSQQDD